MDLAKAFLESGYFADLTTVYEAFVKIQAGRELGIPPFASMTAFHISNGKPTASANLLAALMKREGSGYDFDTLRSDTTAAEIEVFRLDGRNRRRSLGKFKYTIEDAKRAKLTEGPNRGNWAKIPQNMLFARCISNAFRQHCPHLLYGGVMYTPEEMGEVVNGEGQVVVRGKPTGQTAAVVIEAEVVNNPAVREWQDEGYTAAQEERYRAMMDLAGKAGVREEAIREYTKVVDLHTLTPQVWEKVMDKIGAKFNATKGNDNGTNGGRTVPGQGDEVGPGQEREEPQPTGVLAGLPAGGPGDGQGRPDEGHSGAVRGEDDPPVPDEQGGD